MEIYLNDTKYIINTPISSHPCWLCGAEQALKKVIKKFGVINEVFWKLPEKVIKKCMFHIFKYETSKKFKNSWLRHRSLLLVAHTVYSASFLRFQYAKHIPTKSLPFIRQHADYCSPQSVALFFTLYPLLFVFSEFWQS